MLLRKCFRENGKPRKVTLANLSELSPRIIERMRRALRDEPDTTMDGQGMLHILEALPHGAVHAVLGTLRKIGLDKMIASQSSRQRNLVLAMIAGRILFPTSKLGTIRRWKDCTLAQELEVADADEDELYEALDWLLQRQDAIEAKLARKHLGEGAAVLYDVSSSFYHGAHCSLAQFGHNRDGKNGLPIIVYGVLANREGCPVAVQVYAGNTADSKTVMDQVDKLRVNFGLKRVVLTADRGCITTTNITVMREYPQVSRGASKPATKGRNSGVQNQPLVFCLITSNNLSCQGHFLDPYSPYVRYRPAFLRGAPPSGVAVPLLPRLGFHLQHGRLPMGEESCPGAPGPRRRWRRATFVLSLFSNTVPSWRDLRYLVCLE